MADRAHWHQRVRDLWPEVLPVDVFQVSPDPRPSDHFAPEIYFVLSAPLPVPWIIAFLHISLVEGDEDHRAAVILPNTLTVHELQLHMGFHATCTAVIDRCRWQLGYEVWPGYDVFPRQLRNGILLQLLLDFPTLANFWVQVAPSYARPGPPQSEDQLRVGEALHPGPDYWLGCANPTGLRGKEWLMTQLPEGLGGISETHLAVPQMRSCLRAMASAAHEQGKACHLLPGSPVALRPTSQTTGTWAGVLCWSAGVPQSLDLRWPYGEYALGRVQAGTFWFGSLRLSAVNLYGWSRGPTWPRAVEATNSLLQTITQEFVLSHGGPRVIMGDFNLSDDLMPALEIWALHGWVEVQTWAFRTLGREPECTCKHSTTPDKIFVSPEIIPWLKEVATWDLFSDHRPLGARISLPLQSVPQQVWPLPQEVPWHLLHKDQWQAAHRNLDLTHLRQSVQEDFRDWCRQYERSFDGFVDCPGKVLPSVATGRGSIITPVLRPSALPTIRTSRHGEVRASAANLGRTVQKWFLQLRRIQSLRHAVKAAKCTPSAQLYRLELWSCIRHARFFNPDFESWWPTRAFQCSGSPSLLPLQVPALALLDLIYLDFELNYRRMETWHLRRRAELLELTYQHNVNRLFQQVKPAPKPSLSHLQRQHSILILNVEPVGDVLQLESWLPMGEDYDYKIGSFAVNILAASSAEPRYWVDTDGLLVPGMSIEVTQHFSTVPALHNELQRYWSSKWWKNPLPSPSDWTRILAFGRAYLPPSTPSYHTVTMEQWRANITRYSTKAARGPDGISHLDLKMMPDGLLQGLLQQVERWEASTHWPSSLLTGFVHSLAKRDAALEAGDYRPVVIYSIVYRTWSSVRAHEGLRSLQPLVGPHHFGYVPGVETAEVWFVSQALVDVCTLCEEPLVGLVTDLSKAFETIPRFPLKQLALWVGLPPQVVHLWHNFLDNQARRFLCASEPGPPLLSNSGYPEGCALSCLAMMIVNLTFHLYMDRFTQGVRSLSFVDNMEILGASARDLHAAHQALASWIDLWQLTMDKKKTYTWGTTPALRTDCKMLLYPVKRGGKDLGAVRTYGPGLRVQEQLDRLHSLQPLWGLLRRCHASVFQKSLVLRQAFWPRAFYGISICCLGSQHIRSLRSEAMKVLRLNKAGAQPALRLFLGLPYETDPGYYQCWHVITSFRRLCQKQPGVLDLLERFLLHFRGIAGNGPFHKLLEVLGHLGWTLQSSAHITTQDGLLVELCELGEPQLRALVLDAWAQQLALSVAQRKDFRGLQGLDLVTLRRAQQKMPCGAQRWKCYVTGTRASSAI